MNKDIFRMFHWLLIAVVLYVAAGLLATLTDGAGASRLPQVQIVLWKLGHITLGAFAGYWIDRNGFRDRLVADAGPLRQLRRALIMAAAMLAVSMGL